MIKVTNVSKRFKCRGNSFDVKNLINNGFKSVSSYKEAVSNVSFNIKKGEIVGIVGRNGAGKTTLIKSVTGILHPDTGNVLVNGISPHKHRKKCVADIGVVFGQKTQLNYDLTPMEMYRVLKCIYKINDERFNENLLRFTEVLEVEDCIKRPVYQLSLGQKMRAEIICALLHSPSILFLDEPTIGIDVIGKEKIRNCLKQLNESDDITIVITSHDMKDIEEICERVIILDEGKIIYDGSIERLKSDYFSKRIMEIELLNDEDIELNNVILKRVEGKPTSRLIYFDSQKINCNQLISDLVNKYEIKDICVKEISFEQIIKDMYSGNRV
ncbi:MAG: ATP-binding cassette domain-containing protein [Lachnospiraceae bacterium]|nr:ATP-binding cassette domain-containing protein [Lachnospiraceae bacterium]